MSEAAAADSESDRLLDVVVDILETEGYDAVQLREVARRARTSLATIYKRYPTRDDLILGALEYWSREHRYADLPTAAPEASLYEALMHLFRTIFEPWESHPAMLAAYYRVRSSPNGQKLFRFGLDVVEPAGRRSSPASTTNSSPTSATSSPASSTGSSVAIPPGRSP